MSFTIMKSGEALEKVSMKGLEVSLLASSDGTEVIHHKLLADSRWVLAPEENWHALEYLHVLSGRLVWRKPEGDVILYSGDSFYATPVQEHVRFDAIMETEFIYVSSRPVFHYYSQLTKEMREIAITIEEKDGYTAEHCQRITNLSLLIGEKMDLTPTQLNELMFASFLHDIGKIKIPLEILNKPSKLTEEEWEIIKQHTTYGREILEQSKYPPLHNAGKIVEQHHERYDGKGYPHQLKGNEIDLCAAIISVADSYDAMTNDRVYHNAMSKDLAVMEIMRNNGTMYHPKVVEAFLSLHDQLL